MDPVSGPAEHTLKRQRSSVEGPDQRIGRIGTRELVERLEEMNDSRLTGHIEVICLVKLNATHSGNVIDDPDEHFWAECREKRDTHAHRGIASKNEITGQVEHVFADTPILVAFMVHPRALLLT